MQRFVRDLDLDKVAERVRADFLSGARSGVNGTPTFFVNGERYDGSWDRTSTSTTVRPATSGGGRSPR